MTTGLPFLGNYGISDEDVYSAIITGGISVWLLGGGYLVPRGLSMQETFYTVFAITGTQLLIKHFMKTWRETNQNSS